MKNHGMRVSILALVLTLAVAWAIPAGALTPEEAMATDQLALKLAPIRYEHDYKDLGAEIARAYGAYAACGVEATNLDDLLKQIPRGLAPMTADETIFYEGIELISISPDGNKLLIFLKNTLMAVDLANNTLRLVWVPETGVSEERANAMWRMTQEANAIERGSVVWSKDGRYIAFSFPRAVMMLMRLGANLYVADTETGTAWATDPSLPINIKFSETSDYPGFPTRAVFTPDSQALMVERYRVKLPLIGAYATGYYRYDLATRQEQMVGFADFTYQTADPRIWMNDQGLLVTAANVRREKGAGLLSMTPEGNTQLALAPLTRDGYPLMQVYCLVSVAGNRALTQGRVDVGNGTVNTLGLVDTRQFSMNSFDHWIAIKTDTQGKPQIEWLDIKGLAAAMAGEALVFPYGGVLSPDGSHALLAARIQDQPALLLWDLQSNVCKRVDLRDVGLSETAFVGGYGLPINKYGMGLLWAANGHILVQAGSETKLYELAVKSPGVQ